VGKVIKNCEKSCDFAKEMNIKNDTWWQELINTYGMEAAFYALMMEFEKAKSLKQPSPNIELPTITTDKTTSYLKENDGYRTTKN